MLDFRRGARPPNYFARAMQIRLLLLVLALGLVIILAIESRKAKYYRWLIPEGDQPAESVETVAPQGGDGKDRRELAGQSDQAIPGEASSPLGGPCPNVPEPLDAHATPRPSPQQFDQQQALAEQVRDDRGVVPSEWDAWLALFDVLNRADPRQIEAASIGAVTFVQLFDDSESYRGRVVTTRGRIRRAHRADTPRNQFGLTTYYQLWLQPDDHPRDPISVWCLRLPAGFPTGMEIDQRAQITGFYFKRTTYLAGDGKWRRAPMLLARSIHWQPSAEPAATAPAPHSFWLVALAALGLAALATMLVYLRTRGHPSLARAGIPGGADRPEL